MMKNDNYKILYLIRFLPFIFITLGALILYLFISHETQKHFNDDIIFIKKNYVSEEKKRIKAVILRTHKYLNNLEDKSLITLKMSLRESVLSAYKIVENIYIKNKNIKSKKEIISIIKTALRNIRFNEGRGYYFIYDMNGKNIFHAIKPEMEGKVFIDKKDSKGRMFQRDRIELLKKSDNIYFQYSFNKPNDKNNEYEKLSFLKRFKAFNWFIGTGEYLEDFTESIQRKTINYISNIELKDNGYIFIIKDMKIISNLHKDLLGLDISNNNTYNFTKTYKKIKSTKKGTFSHYSLKTKENKVYVENKISYVKYFDKWDWIIGTGFDLDILEKIIDKQQKKIKNEFDYLSKKLIIVSILIVFILLLISYALSKYIENILFKYQKKLEKNNEALIKAQNVAKIINWEIDLNTEKMIFSDKLNKFLDLSFDIKDKNKNILKKIITKEDLLNFEKAIKEVKHYKKKIDCLFKIEEKDDTFKWLDCKGELDELNNKIIGTLQDITQIKRVEEEKQEKEKMLYQQSKMATMGEMLANIAHQWKQPLSTISTASTGIKLQKEFDNLSDEDFIIAMDSINNSVKYLSTTIDDFKNFFKPEQEKIRKFNLENAINKAIRLVQARFDMLGIKIIINAENIKIKSMENELIQVILNFLNNARDAFDELNIPQKYVFINAYLKEDIVIIEVFDNAKGIEESILGEIFKPYFTTKIGDKGTGIGLYMSSEIAIKLLKSKIEVENYKFEYKEINYTGAKFTIKLKKGSRNTTF